MREFTATPVYTLACSISRSLISSFTHDLYDIWASYICLVFLRCVVLAPVDDSPPRIITSFDFTNTDRTLLSRLTLRSICVPPSCEIHHSFHHILFLSLSLFVFFYLSFSLFISFYYVYVYTPSSETHFKNRYI